MPKKESNKTPAKNNDSKEEKQENPKFDKKDIQENKALAVVGYLIFFIPMIVKNDSKFAMFHAKQGMVIAIIAIAVSVFAWIPIIGWLLAPIISLALLIISILGIVNAANGEGKKLPLIGDLADKFNF